MRYLLPLFACLVAATPALAIVAPPPMHKADGFTCDPPEFTLVRNDQGLHLHATLEVPTPGYTYNFSVDDGDAKGGILVANINLQTPEAATAQVISTITIDRQISATTDIHTLNISIDKEFNWGPEKASCSTPVTEEEGTTK